MLANDVGVVSSFASHSATDLFEKAAGPPGLENVCNRANGLDFCLIIASHAEFDLASFCEKGFRTANLDAMTGLDDEDVEVVVDRDETTGPLFNGNSFAKEVISSPSLRGSTSGRVVFVEVFMARVVAFG